MVYIGLDIGTTNTKAVVLSQDGGLLDRITLNGSWQNGSDGGAVVGWYGHFCQTMDYFASKGLLTCEEIACSITAQGGTFVLLNKNFEPVSKVYSWTELAKRNTVQDMIDHFGSKRFYHITGWQPDRWLAVCKIKELIGEKRYPTDAEYISMVPEFIYSQLSGELICDVTNAQVTGMCDFKKGDWHEKILKWAGIDRKFVPPITAKLKVLWEDLNSKWGKINLVTGSHDQYALMQAADLEDDKSVMLGTGTAWVLNGRSGKAVYDEDFLIHPGLDLYDDKFGYIIGLGQIGRGFDKLLANFCVSKDRLVEIIKTFAKEALPNGAVKADCTNGTVEWFYQAEVAIRDYMLWAASMVAFELEHLGLKQNLDKIVMTGGATKSDFWPQVISDVCGLVVETVDFPEFTAYGAALHAKETILNENDQTVVFDRNSRRLFEPLQAEAYRDWYENHQKLSMAENLLNKGLNDE